MRRSLSPAPSLGATRAACKAAGACGETDELFILARAAPRSAEANICFGPDKYSEGGFNQKYLFGIFPCLD